MKIKLFPRIHLTLIGFNKNGYRKFGGIGFSISEPSLEVLVMPSKILTMEFTIEGNYVAFESKILQVLQAVIFKYKLKKMASFSCNLKYPPHNGFGTGTNLTLACLEAIFIINNIDYNPIHIINESLRGRTSGIGIQTYFKGGYVFDIGVKNYDNSFLPSNANNSENISVPLLTCQMPNWEMLVCIPRYIGSVTPELEKDFFVKNTPLKKDEVTNILYHSAFGVTASVMEKDFEVFCSSLNEIQNTKWKFLERSAYNDLLFKLEREIYLLGAKSVAMSSLGPSLVVFSNDLDKLEMSLKIKYGPKIETFRSFSNNKGRIIYD